MLLCYNMSTVLYIFYGVDDFSLSRALDNLKKGWGDPSFLESNTTIFDAQQLSLSQLIEACSTVPFLSPVRVVIVNGLLSIFEQKSTQKRGKKRLSKEAEVDIGEWRGLVDYVKQMPATTMLILVDGGDIKQHNPILKLLSPLAEVKVFPQLNRNQLSHWIYSRVREGGGTISAQAVELLIQFAGRDLWTVSNEVDKLLSFARGRLITEEDVRSVASFAREINIFSLVDAILERDKRQAQKMLWHILREGVSPLNVLAMIARQLRLIVLARELGAEIFKKRGLLGGLENASDYSVQKALEQSRMYTLDRVKRMFDRLLEADIAIKTGKYEGDLALELLVADL